MSTQTVPAPLTPATSGCCGNGAAATEVSEPTSTVRGCCGSAEATAAGQCCTLADRAQAVDAGASCCG